VEENGGSGAGDEGEDFAGVVFAVKSPVGQIQCEFSGGELLGGGDAAGDGGAFDLEDHGEVLSFKN
jgi:hypothetical protein